MAKSEGLSLSIDNLKGKYEEDKLKWMRDKEN